MPKRIEARSIELYLSRELTLCTTSVDINEETSKTTKKNF